MKTDDERIKEKEHYLEKRALLSWEIWAQQKLSITHLVQQAAPKRLIETLGQRRLCLWRLLAAFSEKSHKARGRLPGVQSQAQNLRPLSPHPSPWGEGESYSVSRPTGTRRFHGSSGDRAPSLWGEGWGEGDGSCPNPTCWTTAGTVKLPESSGRAKAVEPSPEDTASSVRSGRDKRINTHLHGQEGTEIWFLAAFDERVTGP